MSNVTDATDKDSPYYRSAICLRDKHQQIHLTSGRTFHAWALNFVPFSLSSAVLDAGCGWGRFTWHLIDTDTISATNVVCADFSHNMLKLVHEEANKRHTMVMTCRCEIEHLPFGHSVFDVVMANHVLYHLTDIHAGLRELTRVLKPGGYLLATTNSERVPVPIIDLHYQALTAAGVSFTPEQPSTFSMENGTQLMREVFRHVSVHYFEDSSEYDTADAFVKNYQSTGRYQNFIAREDIAQATKDRVLHIYRELTQDIINREGKLIAPTLMGAFVCTN